MLVTSATEPALTAWPARPFGGGPSLGLAVPPAGAGTCIRCHGPARGALAECWCCRAVGRKLGTDRTEPPVVPLALCRPGDELHRALRRYKDSPAVTARRHFALLLARMVSAFLDAHGLCVRGACGAWDAVAVVPSSRRGLEAGASPSPFGVVLEHIGPLASLPRVSLGRGPAAVCHLRPAADAFVVDAPAGGRRVLLLDDTWVTGARARSAVAALGAAQASVVAVLVVGRSVDPTASPRRALWWEAQRAAAEGRAGRCCLPGCSGRLRPSAAGAAASGAAVRW